MTATLRPAQAPDIPAVAALIEAAYSHYIPVLDGKPRPMTDDHAARIDRGETFLIEAGGIPVGVTSMALEDDAIHIFNIAIHPDAQGRGLLREVFAFAEALARDKGVGRLTLYTHMKMTRNREIYPHLGFRVVREEDAPGGHRIVLFERPVPA